MSGEERSSEVARLRELFAGLRDIAIASAVFLYFIGFVYMYSYYATFDMSLIITQLPPWYALTFSYHVLEAQPWVALAFVVGISALTTGYQIFFERQRSFAEVNREAVATRDTAGSELSAVTCAKGVSEGEGDSRLADVAEGNRATAGVNPLVPFADGTSAKFLTLWISTVLLIVVIFSVFQLGYNWAKSVSNVEAADAFEKVHKTIPRSLHLSIALKGTDTPSKSFSDDIKVINAAGRQGRALLVAESGDRYFILIGADTTPSDNPRTRLADDQIYSIDKSEVDFREVNRIGI